MSSDGTLSESSRSPRSDGEMHTNRNIIADTEVLEAASILFGMKKQGKPPQEEQPQEVRPQDKRPVSNDWMIKLSLVGTGTRDGEEWDCQLWQGTRIEGCIWISGYKGYLFYRFKKSGNDKFFALPRLKDTVSHEDLRKAAGKGARYMNSLRLDRAILEIRQASDIVESREDGIEVTDTPPKLVLGPWTSRLTQVTEFRNEGKPEGACSGGIRTQDGYHVCEAHKSRDINRTFVEPRAVPKRKRNDKEAPSTSGLTLNKPKQNGNDKDVFSVPAQEDHITASVSKKRKANGKKVSSAQTPPKSKTQQTSTDKEVSSLQTLFQNESQQNSNVKEMTSARAHSTPPQLPTPPGTRSTVSPNQIVRTMRQNPRGGHAELSNPEADHEKKPSAPAPEPERTPTANIPASAPPQEVAPRRTRAPDSMMSEHAAAAFLAHGDQSWRKPPKPKPKKTKAKTKTTKKKNEGNFDLVRHERNAKT